MFACRIIEQVNLRPCWQLSLSTLDQTQLSCPKYSFTVEVSSCSQSQSVSLSTLLSIYNFVSGSCVHLLFCVHFVIRCFNSLEVSRSEHHCLAQWISLMSVRLHGLMYLYGFCTEDSSDWIKVLGHTGLVECVLIVVLVTPWRDGLCVN